MSCTPIPKASKPVWALQMTRLPCLVVHVKFQNDESGNTNQAERFSFFLQKLFTARKCSPIGHNEREIGKPRRF